jgi:hypothetical protein
MSVRTPENEAGTQQYEPAFETPQPVATAAGLDRLHEVLSAGERHAALKHTPQDPLPVAAAMNNTTTGALGLKVAAPASQYGSGGMRAAGAPNRAGRPLDVGCETASVVDSMFGARPTLLTQGPKETPAVAVKAPLQPPATRKAPVNAEAAPVNAAAAPVNAAAAPAVEPFKIDAEEAKGVVASIAAASDVAQKLASVSLKDPATDASAAFDVAQDVVGKLTAEEVKKSEVAAAPVATNTPVSAQEVPVVVQPVVVQPNVKEEAATQEALVDEGDIDAAQLSMILGADEAGGKVLPTAMPVESVGGNILVAFKQHDVHEGGDDVTISAIAVVPDGSVVISTSTTLLVDKKNTFSGERYLENTLSSEMNGVKETSATKTQFQKAHARAVSMVGALNTVSARTEKLVSELVPKKARTLCMTATLAPQSKCAQFLANRVKHAANSTSVTSAASPYFGTAHDKPIEDASTPMGKKLAFLTKRPFFVA